MEKEKKKLRVRISPTGEKIIIKDVGTRIKEWRKGKKLRGIQFSKIIKISQGTLSEIENNKAFPSINTLAKIHYYAGVDIKWLIFGDDKNE